MIKLIINADDFGKAENCTAAIIESLCKGLITNTTFMVSMPSSQKAAAEALKLRLEDRIGLHLNFSQGRPLTHAMRQCRLFCDEEGCFNQSFCTGVIRSWIPFSKQEAQIVYDETIAQMKKYFEFGFTVPHVDSHHHMHMVPRMMESVCAAARAMGFRSVRRPLNLRNLLKFRSKAYYPLLYRYAEKVIEQNGLLTTDFMGDFAGCSAGLVKIPDAAVLEMMVHPMYDESGQLVDARKWSMYDISEWVVKHSAELRLKNFNEFNT